MMLRRMTEEDRTVALEVFRAARSRRGDRGRDDRRFLEALHHFTVHNVTWRALPGEFGRWNSVWKRFWRLNRSGVFDAFSQALAGLSRTVHLVQMFDSTVVRAPVSAAGAKGGSRAGRFKRIALCCEKTAENYAAFVASACGLILIKSVSA
jgi:transposase